MSPADNTTRFIGVSSRVGDYDEDCTANISSSIRLDKMSSTPPALSTVLTTTTLRRIAVFSEGLRQPSLNLKHPVNAAIDFSTCLLAPPRSHRLQRPNLDRLQRPGLRHPGLRIPATFLQGSARNFRETLHFPSLPPPRLRAGLTPL